MRHIIYPTPARLTWADHLRAVVSVLLGVAYLAGFAAIFAASGGVGDGWMPDHWKPKVVLVLSGVGYVFVGAIIWVAFCRGSDTSFPWVFALTGSIFATSYLLSLLA
jgi:hypothetical protein